MTTDEETLALWARHDLRDARYLMSRGYRHAAALRVLTSLHFMHAATLVTAVRATVAAG